MCDPTAPDGLVVRGVACEDELPSGHTDGRLTDVYLATPALRAVVRHPEASLGRVGVGGATLVDAAPWGAEDALYEVVPVVGGGWLAVDAFGVDADAAWFEGVVRAFPGEVAEAEGERRSLRWTADGDALIADGAEALLVHADADWLGGALWGASVLRGDGPGDDLGGVVRFEGDTLIVAPPDAPNLIDATVPVSGTAPGATTLVLADDVGVLGRVAVIDDAFAFAVPTSVTRVRAEALARAASPWASPGEDLVLQLGDGGYLTLSGLQRPARVTWESADGRAGRAALDGRARIGVGDGSVALHVEAGPTIAPIDRVVAPAPVGLPSELAFDPGSRRALVVPAPAARSRDWRGTDQDAVLDAIGRGADLVVLAPDGDVGEAPEDAPIFAVGGSTAASSDGWSVVAWPFAADRRRAGRGAVNPDERTPMQVLRAMQGGDVTNRITAVDLAWLSAVGSPPADLAPAPDAVLLAATLDPVTDWAPWFTWLDRGVALAPIGPLTWATVPDPALFGRMDIERGLLRGRVVAGTGPVIDFTVGRAGPGDVVPSAQRGGKVSVEVRGCSCTHGALVGDGEVVASFDPSSPSSFDLEYDGRWLLALAWSDRGAWAVTGPVWTDPPP